LNFVADSVDEQNQLLFLQIDGPFFELIGQLSSDFFLDGFGVKFFRWRHFFSLAFAAANQSRRQKEC